MRFAAIVALLLMALSGCKTLEQRRSEFANANVSYIGKNADDLIVAKGPPSNVATLSTGGKVFEYSKSRTETGGGGSYTTFVRTYNPGTGQWVNVPQQKVVPIYTEEKSCKLLFKISPSNIVESWSSEGKDCY